MTSYWADASQRSFDKAQSAYDRREPPDFSEECEICIFWYFGTCHAKGETRTDGGCPSFKD